MARIPYLRPDLSRPWYEYEIRDRWWLLAGHVRRELENELPIDVINMITGQAQALELARRRWTLLRPYRHRDFRNLRNNTEDGRWYWVMGRRWYRLVIDEIRAPHTRETIVDRSYYVVDALLPRAILGLLTLPLKLLYGDWRYDRRRHAWRRPDDYQH